MTIGERAYKAIKEKCGHRKIKKELDRMGILQSSIYGWKNGELNPSAYYLQQMALAGYDVFWILTGERKNEKHSTHWYRRYRK